MYFLTVKTDSLKLKRLYDGFVFTNMQLLSSPDVNWWTGVVWIIVMFLSDSHSDGTHSLQSIHYWDTETHFSKSDEETNSSTPLMLRGWSTIFAHFHLRYSLNIYIIISPSQFSVQVLQSWYLQRHRWAALWRVCVCPTAPPHSPLVW